MFTFACTSTNRRHVLWIPKVSGILELRMSKMVFQFTKTSNIDFPRKNKGIFTQIVFRFTRATGPSYGSSEASCEKSEVDTRWPLNNDIICNTCVLVCCSLTLHPRQSTRSAPHKHTHAHRHESHDFSSMYISE